MQIQENQACAQLRLAEGLHELLDKAPAATANIVPSSRCVVSTLTEPRTSRPPQAKTPHSTAIKAAKDDLSTAEHVGRCDRLRQGLGELGHLRSEVF